MVTPKSLTTLYSPVGSYAVFTQDDSTADAFGISALSSFISDPSCTSSPTAFWLGTMMS